MYTCPSVKCCARPGVSVYPEAKLPGRGKEKEREEGSDEDGGERFASRPQDRDKVFDKYPRGCIDLGRESRWHFLNYSVTIKFLRAAAATGRQQRRSSLSILRTTSGMKADRASVNANANARANERRVLGSVTKI